MAGAPVTVAELQRACGGALRPTMRFASEPLAEAMAGFARRREERGGDDANAISDEAAAFDALALTLTGGGGGGGGGDGEIAAEDVEVDAGSAVYLRPVEDFGGGGGGGCVYAHFIVARTARGSLFGVVGSTVWT